MSTLSALILAYTLTLFSPERQQQTFAIQGSVTLEGAATDQPLMVYLEALGVRPIEQVFTDGAGNFRFWNVPAGSYYIRVRHEGFQEAAQRVEIPAYNRDVSIILERKRKESVPEGEAAIGGKFQVDLRQLSIPEEAVREYQKALEENKRGKTPNAIQRLRRALRLAPNFIEAAFHLGSTLYKIGHFKEAEVILKQALQIVPKESHVRLMLANVLVQEGKYQDALSEIDAFLKENPNASERSSAEKTRSQLIQAIGKKHTP